MFHTQGIEKDDEKAIQLWTKAANQDNQDAQVSPPFISFFPLSLFKDDEKAFQLCTKAAKQDNQKNLFPSFFFHPSLFKDDEKAIQF